MIEQGQRPGNASKLSEKRLINQPYFICQYKNSLHLQKSVQITQATRKAAQLIKLVIIIITSAALGLSVNVLLK